MKNKVEIREKREKRTKNTRGVYINENTMPLCPQEGFMTFKEYLKDAHEKQSFGETPMGDFADDVAADKSFRDFKDWEELETYLLFHGAIENCMRAAKQCWRKWNTKYGKKA